MLTAALMAKMDDDHLVAALHAEFDPIVATDVEIELLKRFEACIKHSDITDLVEEHEINAEEVDALGKALSYGVGIADLTGCVAILEEFSAIEPAALRAKLERADKFYDIAQEAGDAFSRLSELVAETN